MSLRRDNMREVLFFKRQLFIDEKHFVTESLDRQNAKPYIGLVRPIDQRRYIDYKSQRLRKRLLLIALEKPPATEGDFAQVAGHENMFRLCEIREYTRHYEIELEALIR